MIFLAVTHTARTSARTGIQTVTRNLASAWSDAVPVSWFSRGAYLHTLKPEWNANLGRKPQRRSFSIWNLRSAVKLLRAGVEWRIPLKNHPVHGAQLTSAWLVMPELMDGDIAAAMITHARSHGMRTAAIFHDAIPIQRPDLTERSADAHAHYIRALGGCDLVLPVSQASADAFVNAGGTSKLKVVPLPAEFAGVERVTNPADPPGNPEILCVSTLERRKNHLALLNALAGLPNLSATLHLAGEPSQGAPEIAEQVRAAAARDPRIRWHRGLSGNALAALYRRAHFTVYPSFLEGFGLPVMESLWFARPCICANFGVMAENAAAGGCLTLDVLAPADLRAGICQLASDATLRRKLAERATIRPLRAWRDYAEEIAHALD
jgi:glycosyltransferase involved in cell wall biosynthesis